MSPFDRDTTKHSDAPSGAPPDPTAASSSNSDAEDSAAHIAELVRRTGERHARSTPSPAPPANVTAPQPPTSDLPVQQPDGTRETQRFEQRVGACETQRFELPVGQPQILHLEKADTPPSHPETGQPSIRLLLTAGAIVVALILGGFALLRPGGLTAALSSSVPSSAPALYAVRVTDVIKDCAKHSHGRARDSFQNENCMTATRFLATGQVQGRPTVYVVSKIQMSSADTAASVKEVLDATDTGNLNDLLREGSSFPGAPNTMPDSGYASVQTGAVVVVAEAGFIRGPSSNTNPALRAAAAQVAAAVTARG